MNGGRVIQLPGAAAGPVANPKRRGRLPGSVPTIQECQRRRARRLADEALHSPQSAAGSPSVRQHPNWDLHEFLQALLVLVHVGEVQGLACIYNRAGPGEASGIANAIVGDLGPDRDQITQQGQRLLWHVSDPKGKE